ncbi:MAG: hypothetical protein LQ351_001544 [Letrouitia transgressa]|nr:MAG: hypothetical protein LQ351_001544 [Letrouitia transgressa]
MDPITGIGLVASVIQLVHSGINAAKACQQIYQQGSTKDLANVASTANYLTDLTSSLQQSLYSTETQSTSLSQEESNLIDLAWKCEKCADKLQHELHINLKDIITSLEKSQTSIATPVQQESERTSQQLTARVDQLEHFYADDRLYQEVRKSLFYPEIFSRQEQVANKFDGIEDSYE